MNLIQVQQPISRVYRSEDNVDLGALQMSLETKGIMQWFLLAIFEETSSCP